MEFNATDMKLLNIWKNFTLVPQHNKCGTTHRTYLIGHKVLKTAAVL